MLDTVRVGFHISLTKIQLENRGYRLDKDSKGKEMVTNNSYLGVPNETRIKVTYNLLNYKHPLPLLQYDLSLRKKLYGNNVSLISNEEETSITETQRQARSCNYRPGSPTGNTRDEDNYLTQKYTIEVFPVKSLTFRYSGYVVVGFSALGAKER
jgi:hypothetical protein